MHHKKHETRHQSTSTHHYRLATRSSILKSNKVKRLIKSSTLRNGIICIIYLYLNIFLSLNYQIKINLMGQHYSIDIHSRSMRNLFCWIVLVRLYVSDNLLINSDEFSLETD